MRAHGRFRELLDAAPDAIIEARTDGRIVLVNNTAVRMFGYTREEFLSLAVEELLPLARRERHVQHREEFSRDPATRPMGTAIDLQAVRKGGEAFPVEISLSPIQSEDGLHVIAIVRDVSARKLAEDRFRELQERFTRELEEKNRQLEQRDRLKSEFLASMSHELRSPLHTIIGFAELLGEELEGPLNEKQKRFVSNIHHDSQHLLALINDLLDISKIEAGRMEFHPEPFSLRSAVEEVLEMMRPQADVKPLRLEMQIDESIAVRADRLRLRQVLTNLLSNAVKFTTAGGLVRITASRRPHKVAVSVTDTGVGIAREDHEAIFDKFYQVGSTTKGIREGTGLGLAITKRLVEQQGGAIWVCSEPGRGSQFTFTVPAAAQGPVNARPLVLIIEDKSSSAELLMNYVTPEGFDTLCAETVAAAARIAQELSPEAIIVDLSNPGAHAARMVRELRAEPVMATVPIVLVAVTEADEEDARSLGVYAHLTKPVGKRQLLETLARAVSARPDRAAVLVVDDDPMARELLASILREAGYPVLGAESGEQALEYLSRGGVAAMVLDLIMPGASGFEVLARVRENPSTATLPVIVLTGMDLNRGEAERLEAVAVAILRKGQSWKLPLLGALRKSVP